MAPPRVFNQPLSVCPSSCRVKGFSVGNWDRDARLLAQFVRQKMGATQHLVRRVGVRDIEFVMTQDFISMNAATWGNWQTYMDQWFGRRLHVSGDDEFAPIGDETGIVVTLSIKD